MNAARAAKIDDVSVPMTDGPGWNTVLHDWSRKIEAYVKSKNTEMVPEYASLSQQINGAVSMFHRLEKKVNTMSDLMQDRMSDNNSIQLMRENTQLQNATIQLKKENKRLWRQLAASINLSPMNSPALKRAAEAPLSPAAGMNLSSAKRPCIDSSFTAVAASLLAAGKPLQQSVVAVSSLHAMAGAPYHCSALDGIHNTQALKVGGVTISKELGQLWNENILIQKKKVAAHAHGADPPKRILFDNGQHLFVGYHPSFAGNESRTYENGMTVVAMSMTKQQWDTMLGGQLDSNASRMLFASIEKESMEFCLQLEVETGIKKGGKTCAARPGLHSLGSRFRAIKKKWRELGKSELEIENIISRRTGDGG